MTPDKSASPIGLRTVIYRVPDIDRGKAWYTAAFGVEPYFDQPFYVGYTVGGFELGLDPDATDDLSAPGAGGGTAYWGVADADLSVAHFLKVGATLRSAVRDVGEGIRVASVADPFGNTIGLIENPHFNAGAVR